MVKNLCIFLSMLVCNIQLNAQKSQETSRSFFFIQNSVDQNIFYDQIEAILLDKDGFLWLATSTGLYSFDGHEYNAFMHNPESRSSISENFSTTLFEDEAGKIWIGTFNNGLNVFDKQTNTFYVYRRDPNSVSSVADNKIPRRSRVIAQDADGFVWISTQDVLNKIDHRTKSVERHIIGFENQILYNDVDHTFWLGSETLKQYSPGKGLIDLGLTTNSFNEITELETDLFNNVWLGTNKGIFIYLTEEKTLVPLNEYLDTGSDSLPTTVIRGLYRDVNGNIWFGSGKKIYIAEVSTGRTTVLKYNESISNGILDEEIRGIYGNQNGLIYITYQSRGVTSIQVNTNHFRNLGDQDILIKGSSLSNVRSIYQDQENNLWLGTYNHGLIRFHPEKETKQFVHNVLDCNTITSNFITAILIDSRNRLWVGSFENGYAYTENQYNPGSISFSRSETTDIEIHEFYEDKAGNIWIATNEGLFIHDRTDESARRYGERYGEDKLVQNINVQSMLFEEPNVLWFASWNKGIGRLEVNSMFGNANRKDSLYLFENIFDIEGSRLDNRFINLSRDPDGNFWVASSSNGLIKMTVGDSVRFQKYDISKGAPSNTIYSIVLDKTGFLWISTTYGLGKFDPDQERFFNYFKSDGLLSNSFIWDSHFQSEDGEIMFGSIKGLTRFYPDSIRQINPSIQAYLTKLYINHSEIEVGQVINNRVLLDKNIRFLDELTLTHREINFSIEFAALNVPNPAEVKFSYKLDGMDKDWIQTVSASRLATYTNLRPGTYFFRVRATRNASEWSEPTVNLEINVLPPWWETTWAYSLYALVTVLIIYSVQREFVHRTKLRHKLELETYKHERDNELNKEKFKFFTNLSHELRTPLTLILGPLARMLGKREVNNRVRQNLLLIQNQALRLQNLTNQLMDFRKYEIENLKLRAAEGNVINFIEEIFVAFRQHAKIKQINFKLNLEIESLMMYYDRDKLEIILVNLLSNAFKFTSQNGKVELCVGLSNVERVKQLINEYDAESSSIETFSQETRKVIEIEVKDNGVGVSQDQLAHVFERYFQASNLQSISIGGTGIGLEITKNYVELHHGCIMARSALGKGTSFFVWLPVGRGHLREDEILRDFKPSEHEEHYRFSHDKGIVEDHVMGDLSGIQADPGRPTILIVDDNPDIIYFLKHSFENEFNVISAQNGSKGLELTQQHLPDIIISDIMMPEIDGLELCYKVKGDVRTSHIPVILLTARTANVFQVEGLESGADDYITKPFDEQILNLRVRNLIKSRKQLRERYSKETSLLPEDLTITKPDEEFLKKTIGIIEDNIASSDLSVEWLARQVGMSHSVLYKKIIALTDLTVVEFIRSVRLKKASILISETDRRISEISRQVGFADSKYFSKCFQNFFGKTPTEFKNKE